MTFSPDYTNLEKSARNIEVARTPLYEHQICTQMMETVLGKPFAALRDGNYDDKKEFFRHFCEFFATLGYDTVSFEGTIASVMPGSGSLYGHKEGVIQNREDFDRYPWDEIPDLFFARYGQDYAALRDVMPLGMKAVGGPGNGVFECVQDVVGYANLCIISVDDPPLYEELFAKVGETNFKIWQRFMKEFNSMYAVLRFGDDLGFKSNTLLSSSDIIRLILPAYQKIVALVHQYHKPFLFHSCGCIFDVMEPLISQVQIDAKHSNEDQIAPFPVWVERYGDRIGNFGGVDTDALCRLSEGEIRAYVLDVLRQCRGHGGLAFGSGNSIPDYVPPTGYLAMINTLREYRGDFK